MKALVLGGTRYFGIHLVNSLLEKGHTVTIATRGRRRDRFGDRVERLIIERTDPDSLRDALAGKHFDAACDNLVFCPDDVRHLLYSLDCGRYIMTSSAAVYSEMRMDLAESCFDPLSYSMRWGTGLDYGEGKRQAESALFQRYGQFNPVAVRFPYVIGEDDYTGRLFFYVENIVKGEPVHIDNRSEKMAFIRSDEAGEFIAWAAGQSFNGPVNAASKGTISLGEVIGYVEKRTGKKAIFSKAGHEGPYNGQKSFSLDVTRAENLGYSFTILEDWIWGLLDRLIEKSSQG
jgi:nucleoside-diphosphate-sugar epimerase